MTDAPDQSLSPRQRYERRRAMLEDERASWIEHWREISEFILPRRGRFLSSDRNRGDKRNGRIIDSTATTALRTLASGMMSGITSPARPWFRLSLPDPDLADFGPVKQWLALVESRMRQVFERSNLYNVLHSLYEELGAFGTACMVALPDEEDAVRFYPFTAGEYSLALSERLDVDTIYREYSLTVGQLVRRHGLDSVSRATREAFARGHVDHWVAVVEIIEPNINARDGSPWAGEQPFRFATYEKDAGEEGGLLAEGGFAVFPGMAPRWSVMAADVYGRSPAMDALGDVKQLQAEQKRKAQAIDKMVDPPMVAPASLKNQYSSVLPGDVTYVDIAQAGVGFAPAYQINPRLAELAADIAETQHRINHVFYADLFLMLASSDRRQMTATEVAERHEEKLLALGPVLERLQDELLEPLIDITFARMLEAGALPPPPDELQGLALRVEYISVMAQAQKMVATGALERFSGFAQSLMAAKPDLADKVDFEAMLDTYGDMLGVPPQLLVPAAQLQQTRQARQQQAMTAQMAQMAGPALGALQSAGPDAMADLAKAAGPALAAMTGTQAPTTPGATPGATGDAAPAEVVSTLLSQDTAP